MLAWSNLLHEKVRTAVAVSGVAFAVVLMFMQLGFLNAVERTATVIYDALDFDILLRAPTYLHVSDPRSFPMHRLRVASTLSTVDSVVPFYVAINGWQNPVTLKRWSILTMGVRPGTNPFKLPSIHNKTAALSTDATAIIDRESLPKYGPANGEHFGHEDIGRVTELGNKKIRIAETFELGTGLAANAAVIVTDSGFARVTPRRSAEQVSLGLVRLSNATDATIQATSERLSEELSTQQDVVVLTRQQVIEHERRYWLFDKSIGIIFMMGVAVAFIVGLAIVYQVLSSDVAKHLGEYATLKAIGYGNMFVSRVVVLQALILGLLGYFAGWLLSLVLFAITSAGAGIPIQMDGRTMMIVFVATILMCCSSGLAALRKAYRAEPASLF